MITNDRQYKITKAQIQELQQSLDGLTEMEIPENVHTKIFEAQKEALKSQLYDLISDVEEYDALKAGQIVTTEVKDFNELPWVLIKARIANGLTQVDLANLLDVKEQQIQRYESELYSTASLKTLQKIAEKLNVKISGEAQLKAIKVENVDEQLNPNNYPFKEMFKRGWFGHLSNLNEALTQSSVLLFKHFDKAGLNNLQYSLNRKSVRSGSKFNQFALDAWYARVITQAKEQASDNVFNKDIINTAWLRNLAALSTENNGPAKAANYLIGSGISFVIEPSLEGTFLDGAALLIDDEKPVVALTLRYDRLDNFWFVLFHELAHIFLHLGGDLEAIFDDLDSKEEGIEKEADDFALDALIPNEIWRKSLVRFNPSKEAILNQAKKLNVHPALVAGRIRRETGKYHQFSDLVGQGEVRTNFIHQN